MLNQFNPSVPSTVRSLSPVVGADIIAVKVWEFIVFFRRFGIAVRRAFRVISGGFIRFMNSRLWQLILFLFDSWKSIIFVPLLLTGITAYCNGCFWCLLVASLLVLLALLISCEISYQIAQYWRNKGKNNKGKNNKGKK